MIAKNKLVLGQFPPRKIAPPNSCPLDGCPQTIAPEENCPPPTIKRILDNNNNNNNNNNIHTFQFCRYLREAPGEHT